MRNPILNNIRAVLTDQKQVAPLPNFNFEMDCTQTHHEIPATGAIKQRVQIVIATDQYVSLEAQKAAEQVSEAVYHMFARTIYGDILHMAHELRDGLDLVAAVSPERGARARQKVQNIIDYCLGNT